MAVGRVVRRMFGPHERAITDLWRSIFIDLDDLTRNLLAWAPDAQRILEIGCGEGGVTEQLAKAYPRAEILGIDITASVGRLYRGRSDGVSFRQVTVQEVASEQAGRFDLIVMCDVIHHVPRAMRAEILAAARTLLAPGGRFVFKDWMRTTTPIHYAAYAADRWLTGDEVEFLNREEAVDLITESFPGSLVGERTTIKPWRNNFALLVQ